MYFSTSATTLALLTILPSSVLVHAVHAVNATRSDKRGLIYITTEDSATDDAAFTGSNTGLTWYYNYGAVPTSSLESTSLAFVPMLWGAPSSPTTDTSFLDSIKSQLSSGSSITHILTFNEPDGTTSTGGSSIDPSVAAQTWLTQITPLRSTYGLKVGLPAVTGSESGFTWLSNFNSSCHSLSSNSSSTTTTTTNCTADFIPIHWYGNFEGLASHIGQVQATYPDLPIWITEYGYPYQSLSTTQDFYNTSAEYFDRLDYVARYSWFGAFRSDVSNVGPNAAFFTQKGKLTDIGSWYLGGAETGNVPKGTAAPGKGVGGGMGWKWVLGIVGGVCLLLDEGWI
ncbi:putative glycoside hydrolase subgroup catalytic core [Phaeomoniella chlamydospora]|uniref:Putative glycoside hydrolase subgroup catalytic core n=1 Tax=Phaeomoniella chlamydospora TaxID=158046 RepID=A0A0G2EQY5_PHACM|nr:putative glycoside hydrolase subgroup catalytic core [Phaeomoniella chlamydospora]